MKARELLHEVATLTHHNLKVGERLTSTNFFLLEPNDIVSIRGNEEGKDWIVMLWKQEDEWTYVMRHSFTGKVEDYITDKKRWAVKQSALPDLDAVYQGKF